MKFAILCYFTCLFLILLYNKLSKSPLSLKSYVQSNKFLIASSIFSTAIGGATIFGITDKAYLGQMEYCYALILAAISTDIMFGLYVYPKLSSSLNHNSKKSLGNFAKNYYGNLGKKIIGISAIIVSIGSLSVQIKILGNILYTVASVSQLFGCILSVLCIIVNNTLGRYNIIILSGKVHFFLIIFSVIFVFFTGIDKIGIEQFICLLPHNFSLFSGKTISNTFILFLCFSCLNFNPAVIKRTLVSKDSNVMRSAFTIKVVIYVFCILFITLNGILARYIITETTANYCMIIHLIFHLPNVVQVIATFGILSAILSTADTDLSVISSSIMQDIINVEHFSSAIRGTLYYISIILAMFFALLLAFTFVNIIDTILFIAGFWFPYIGISMVAALHNIVLPQKSFILLGILVATILICINLFFIELKFYGVVIATVASVFFFFIYFLYQKYRLNFS